MRNKKNCKNQIVLVSFAAAFSVMIFSGLMADRKISTVEAAQSEVSAATTEVSMEIASAEISIDDAVVASSIIEPQEEVVEPELPYVVTEYETAVTMYASDTINVRTGAGTDYDRLGRLSWGSQLEVTGETDNNWYEVSYKGNTGYISGDYVVTEMPSIPYLFVGDSRTVQLKMAVGSTDKAYVAKVGEGYSWFKNTAISEIQEYAGNGTTMIINFGVNDLANASNYINLVNSYIDTWINAGITVYYSSVTPVGSYPTVSNAQIESFNAKLQAELDPRIKWIDSYSYLIQTGFNTSDGLHYDKSTYKNLYSYYMSVVATDI
jgi:hypothetical protein